MKNKEVAKLNIWAMIPLFILIGISVALNLGIIVTALSGAIGGALYGLIDFLTRRRK